MLSTIAVVLPIFALILVGYVSRRVGILGPHATRELNRFVVYLALPALDRSAAGRGWLARLLAPG
ncbi:MAG: AEC family transporter [Acetobacteraceae bacterium]